jgi:transposase InsO family protein
VGQRFHLCRHLKGLRLRGFRHRCLRPQDRRLARQHLGACRVRPRCPGTGCPRAAPGQGYGHHSARGSQYLSIKYTERLAEAGIEPSVGCVGDSYDNALAETINGLFKAEVIHRRGPWRTFEALEYATLEWVDWFNNRRLLEPIGNIPPAEAEANFYAALETEPMAA